MNKTAIVTGAANGIGKAVATAFAKERFSVIVADIDSENGTKLQDQLREDDLKATFVECDVSDPDSIDNLVEETVQRYGGIHVLINNAGVSTFTPPDVSRSVG